LASGVGRVAIVGAGPGDPDLLTVKALRLIREAEVVVFDRLVSEAILALVPTGAKRVFAGKIAHNHYVPQEHINALLVSLARAGRAVVRLKGGDPFLFGRGGEEAAHLATNGIPFEIVPGITSASGCTTYAGIPLTHRDLAHGVRLITGHSRGHGTLELDWASLADPDTTLVIYMGRIYVRQLAEGLIRHGLPADMPAAVIVNGTRPDQIVIVTTVAELPSRIEGLDMAAPTLLVVGRVVALADQLRWFDPEVALSIMLG
jgi:uroporphyrin-III C-methyltransferase/precorrin-2 dehydrogenase/sirohydrochlorin ferrochelatase/uroporphyrin-III C-methyltransferase